MRTNTTKGDSYAYGLHHLSHYYHLRNQPQEANGEEDVDQLFRQKMCEQEACFNVARAFHELGFLQMCIPFYELALGIAQQDEKDLLSFLPAPSATPSPSPFLLSDSPLSDDCMVEETRKRKGSSLEGSPQRKRRKQGETERDGVDEEVEKGEEGEVLDLKFEAAYNLSRVYFSNGFYQKSLDLIQKFMVV